ncbi:MAG: prephenate dehydratase domain-containing protein [Bacteroidota bacterium]
MNAAISAPALRVSIQGVSGAFHEIASRRHFSEQSLEIVAAQSFEEEVDQLLSGVSDRALMAIENTVAGSLMNNFDLLYKNDLQIVGEEYLRIEQNLLGLPGCRPESLKEVHSHYMAIAQCRQYFRQYPHIRLVESADTALSAKEVAENGNPAMGAIASSLAADLFGLEILAPSIETNKKNHTRFLVLAKGRKLDFSAGNKVSLCFAVAHEPGAFFRVLAVLAAYQINLTKIQSTPIVGEPWNYRFFLDFIAEGQVGWIQAMDAIKPITKNLRILGVYPAGQRPN